MHGPYPGELRTRVIDFVEEGGSRREVAEQFDVNVSSAIRWVQRFRENGTSEPIPSGGSTSPLEKHSRQILALISEELDLTLNEIVSALHATMEGLHRCVGSYIRGTRSCGMHRLLQTCGVQTTMIGTRCRRIFAIRN